MINKYKRGETMLIKKQIDKFIKEFAKKQGITEYDSYDINWVANRYGGVLNFGDNYFSFDDIMLDMETNQPADNIFNWQDTITDAIIRNDKFQHQNYNTWLMNGNKLLDTKKEAIRLKKIDLESKIKELKSEIDKLGL